MVETIGYGVEMESKTVPRYFTLFPKKTSFVKTHISIFEALLNKLV